MLADHAAAVGDTDKSEAAHLRHLRCASQNPDLQKAAAAMIANELPVAERLLKSYLKAAPTDVTAVRMLAEVAVRVGRNDEAQALLEYCLELAPGFRVPATTSQSCCTGPISLTRPSARWKNCLPSRSGRDIAIWQRLFAAELGSTSDPVSFISLCWRSIQTMPRSG